nr:PREDICTED: uncharacterized protein LOC107982431 [Anolis carolinensis]|eukprot:XP_016846941.1 PREDICTED: uncharacterized protein LOC107982431 [Anolis carolinensis]
MLSNMCDLLGQSMSLLFYHLKILNEKLDYLVEGIARNTIVLSDKFCHQEDRVEEFLDQIPSWHGGRENETLTDFGGRAGVETDSYTGDWEKGKSYGKNIAQNCRDTLNRLNFTDKPCKEEIQNLNSQQRQMHHQDRKPHYRVFQSNKLAFDVLDIQLNRDRWKTPNQVKRSIAQILSLYPSEIKISSITWLSKNNNNNAWRLLITFDDAIISKSIYALKPRLCKWGISVRRVFQDIVIHPLLPGLRGTAQRNSCQKNQLRPSIPVSQAHESKLTCKWRLPTLLKIQKEPHMATPVCPPPSACISSGDEFIPQSSAQGGLSPPPPAPAIH